MVVQYGGLLEGEYQVQIKLEYNEPWQQFLNPELSHQPEQEIPWAPGYSGGNGMGTSFDQVHYPDEVRLGGEDFKREVSESGDGFNWGIPIGAVGTAISAGTEYADNKVRTAFKTGRNPVSWSKLTPRQQAWRTANVLGKNAKYIKYAKGAGVIGTGVSVGMAGRDIFMGEGTMIDYFDVGVGTASLGAVIFLASNPVGWAIGSGAAIYFAGRLVYDFYEEIND
jgi:hypothetical protein